MTQIRLGVLTSGGDAQGMNAAVRAVVRTAHHFGAQPYAIHEGWQGAVDGGEAIVPFGWDEVGHTLNRGGTIIGTARCLAFRERDGRRVAAKHLLENGIDRLVVIGGDGSLTGTDLFRREWPELLQELVAAGEITRETADAHPSLMIAGLVGSIDNDLVGTESTIGADSAMHRIVEAIDALSSTAAAHQRSFVIEVMGRHCGYLPLMAAIAGGCDYVFVPENPPKDTWPDELCAALSKGRRAGRRDSLVIIAEGATDRAGNSIRAADVKRVIEERLGEDTRETILGHVQRGGTPSAYDRWMSTVLGYEAVRDVLSAKADSTAHILGVQGNRVVKLPLVETIQETRAVADLVADGQYSKAMRTRGSSFVEMLQMFRLLCDPPEPDAPKTNKRVAVLHIGGLASGMNPAARAAVRLGIAAGHTMLGVHGSLQGLIDNHVTELTWADVDSWLSEGGAELGTRRTVPNFEQLYEVSKALERHDVDAMLVIGGFNAYLATHLMHTERERYPALRIPIVVVPASIDNNLPGSEMAIGADTALNDAVGALDRIRQSASASKRAFVAEIMGRHCGYLTLLSGLAAGAARVYLHEDGITLRQLEDDVTSMRESFTAGRKFYMVLRNEQASQWYTTDVIAKLFAAEAHGLYDVREAILGHVQQGGNPTPADRVLATRLAAAAIDDLTKQLGVGSKQARYVGLVKERIVSSPFTHMLDEVDQTNRRPVKQWWRSLAQVLSAVGDVRTVSEKG